MLELQEIIVFPIHPRTRKNLQYIRLPASSNKNNIFFCDPLGYLEFTCLEAHAKYVVTDSGGIQEETTALNVPCFTLRENTERPSTLIKNGGTNTLISRLSDIDLLPQRNNNISPPTYNSVTQRILDIMTTIIF